MIKPPLIPSLITAFFVILMFNLGVWQMNRAEQKEELLILLADNNVTTITKKDQIKKLPKYANVELHGHYLSHPQLLLDNQVNNKIVGYHVFTPFIIKDIGQIIMVNRGWIDKNQNTGKFLTIDNEQVRIAGKLNNSPQVGIQLGEIKLELAKNNQLITYFDNEKIFPFLYAKLCENLDCVISKKILWLKADQAQGFKRDWNPIIMPPSKHIGYAVQWFLMTFVLIILFFYWVKKQNSSNKELQA